MDTAKIIEVFYNEQKKAEGPYEARHALVEIVHNTMVEMEIEGITFTATEFHKRLHKNIQAQLGQHKAA